MSSPGELTCTLSLAERPRRADETRELGRASLLAIAADADGAVLRFRGDAPTRQRLEAFVAAESRCCPFLALELRDEPGSVALAVSAPPGGEPVVRSIAGVFAAGWAEDL